MKAIGMYAYMEGEKVVFPCNMYTDPRLRFRRRLKRLRKKPLFNHLFTGNDLILCFKFSHQDVNKIHSPTSVGEKMKGVHIHKEMK